MDKTSKGKGSPHRRYPDLCYRNVYLERDLFNMVHLFGHWNHVSDKRAVHQLITYGLQYYATAIVRAEKARQSGTQSPPTEQLYSLDAIAAIVENVRKQQKQTKTPVESPP